MWSGQKQFHWQQNYISLSLSFFIKINPGGFQLDRITQEEIFDTSSNGDIILFQNKNFRSKLQRGLTGSTYDHVGLLVVFYKFGKRYVEIIEALGGDGVIMRPWTCIVQEQNHYSLVSYRKLKASNKQAQDVFNVQFHEFCLQNRGLDYKLSASKLLRGIGIMSKKKKKNEEKNYFCSELVAEAYKQTGVISMDTYSEGIWPGNFSQSSQKITLINGFSLTLEAKVFF